MSSAETTTSDEHQHAHDHDHAHEHTHTQQPRPLGECEREVAIEVPVDVVEKERETLLAKYAKLARIPGFRPGKAPKSLVKSRFENELGNDLVEALLPRYFREKVKEQGLTPISQPQITDLHVHEGEPLKFKARFEILPEIEVAGYGDIQSEKAETTVSEEEVEAEINQMREQMASFEPVAIERPIQEGDFAQVSLDGHPKESRGSGLVDASGRPLSTEAEGAGEEEAPKPVHMDDVMVEIGGKNTVKEFSDNLTGANAGESRTFDVVYPEDFTDKRLAGKTFVYTLQVKAVKNKVVPELDEKFAKELGDFPSVDEMRSHLRQRMEARRKHDVEHKAKDKIVEELVSRNQFPVPEVLVEHQISTRLERGLRALAQQGMREEQLKKLDFGRLREGQREPAVREVKASLILEKIADKENVEVSDDEVNKEIEMISLQSRQPLESVRERLTREGTLDRIRERLRNEKTLDLLYQRSA